MSVDMSFWALTITMCSVRSKVSLPRQLSITEIRNRMVIHLVYVFIAMAGMMDSELEGAHWSLKEC